MANIGKYTTVQFSVASVTRNESIWVEAMIAPLTDRSGEGFPLAVSQSPDKQLKKVSICLGQVCFWPWPCRTSGDQKITITNCRQSERTTEAIVIITFVLICANNNDVHIEKMSPIPDDPFFLRHHEGGKCNGNSGIAILDPSNPPPSFFVCPAPLLPFWAVFLYSSLSFCIIFCVFLSPATATEWVGLPSLLFPLS